MTDADPRCAICGAKRSEHHYSYPFVWPSEIGEPPEKAKSEISQADRIAELEGKLEVAMEGLVKAEDKINELVYMADPWEMLQNPLCWKEAVEANPAWIAIQKIRGYKK